MAPIRIYTILDADRNVIKFGVTDAAGRKADESLKIWGMMYQDAAMTLSTEIVTKQEAHVLEKYMRSLHYNSTGIRALNGMNKPFPVDFLTGEKIPF